MELYARSLAITPAGAQTMSKQRARYGDGIISHLDGGHGAYVTGVDGREYLDWTAGLAAVTLGHAHPGVTYAIQQQACHGGTLGLPHRLEVEISERFCAVVGAEQVRWVSTGSEATGAACRIARAATGRDLIVSIGYHSWHAEFAVLSEYHPGVPACFGEAIREVKYNDLDALAALFAAHPDRVAGVILEPTLIEAPAPGYLAGLVELAHAHGALVISDEIVCGFRWHVKGAMWGTFGIRPDLRCFGKAISNGAFPIACVVGDVAILRHAWMISGTFNGHPVGLAAVGAVLDAYARPTATVMGTGPALVVTWVGPMRDGAGAPVCPCGQIDRAGQALMAGWPAEGPLRLVGPPQHPVLQATDTDPDLARLRLSVAVQTLFEAGILWHPGGVNPMACHTGAEIQRTRAALDAARARVTGPDADALLAMLPGAGIQAALAGRADAGHGGNA